jgi:hypothetical protein
MFFFEKKNQKTFAPGHSRPMSKLATDANWQKFFASFFQKRRPFFLTLIIQNTMNPKGTNCGRKNAGGT